MYVAPLTLLILLVFSTFVLYLVLHCSIALVLLYTSALYNISISLTRTVPSPRKLHFCFFKVVVFQKSSLKSSYFKEVLWSRRIVLIPLHIPQDCQALWEVEPPLLLRWDFHFFSSFFLLFFKVGLSSQASMFSLPSTVLSREEYASQRIFQTVRKYFKLCQNGPSFGCRWHIDMIMHIHE